MLGRRRRKCRRGGPLLVLSVKVLDDSGLPSQQGKEQRSMRSFPPKESHQHDLYVQDGVPIFDVIDITTNPFA
jgi:hypothetical protein